MKLQFISLSLLFGAVCALSLQAMEQDFMQNQEIQNTNEQIELKTYSFTKDAPGIYVITVEENTKNWLWEPRTTRTTLRVSLDQMQQLKKLNDCMNNSEAQGCKKTYSPAIVGLYETIQRLVPANEFVNYFEKDQQ